MLLVDEYTKLRESTLSDKQNFIKCFEEDDMKDVLRRCDAMLLASAFPYRLIYRFNYGCVKNKAIVSPYLVSLEVEKKGLRNFNRGKGTRTSIIMKYLFCESRAF